MKTEIGTIVKAQGIKGELKIVGALVSDAVFKNVKTVTIANKEYSVNRFRTDHKALYLLLAEVTDRNTAEELRGKSVYCEKSEILLPNDRYFVDDLIGCSVVLEDGKTVGVISDLLQYGAADVIVCNGSPSFSFPFLKDLVVDIDVSNRRMTVKSKRFEEVVCYED